MRSHRAIAILALALAVRIAYAVSIAGTGCLAINADPISDMETFHRWSMGIVGGDWLGREEFHPYHPWQAGIASEPVWLAWYGPRVFHQDPLYPYALAVVYLVAPRDPSSMIAIQFLLGALTAAGVYLLASRLASERAAIAAGVLAAIYGPFLFYESLLLRDTLLVTLTTAFLLVLEAARRHGSAGWWCGLGALAGGIYLTKPNIVLFLPLLAVWIVAGGEVRRRGVALSAMAAGFLIALAPAVARNLAVGAPAFKTTTRGAIEFINGNNPWHMGIGWFDGDDNRVTGYAREVMTKTRGRLLPTIAVVLATWKGRVMEYAGLQAKKTAFLLAPFEMPNNASFGFFRMKSAVLRWGLPTFYIVSPLAALGLIASLRDWRRVLPHLIFLTVGAAGTVAFYVIARFRTPYLPLLLVFAGIGAARLVEFALEGRRARLAAALTLVSAILAVNTWANHPDTSLVRPQDFLVSAEAWAAEGKSGLAATEIEKGLAIFPGVAPLHYHHGRMRELAGERAAALAAYREALRLAPAYPEAARATARLAGTAP